MSTVAPINTAAYMAAHNAGLQFQAQALEVAQRQLAEAKKRAEAAEAAARINTQQHAAAMQQLAIDRALGTSANAPTITAAPAASTPVVLPQKTTGTPALSLSAAPARTFPVDASYAGRERALEQEAAEGPGFLDQLGAGLSDGLGKFLGNLQLNLGGAGGAQPVTITAGGAGGGGGFDPVPFVLVGAALLAGFVLLSGD